MAVRDILLLGNPDLHRECRPVRRDELSDLEDVVADLRDTLIEFRLRNGAGRAIAAPQIGVFKRLVYQHVDAPVVYINPELEAIGDERIELWDDCMSFPDLLVRVRRFKRCRLRYRDMRWNETEIEIADAASELMQHECDHLDGILAVSRAIDGRSFALKSQTGALRSSRTNLIAEQMLEPVKVSAKRVRDALVFIGVEASIVELPRSARTAAAAADAIGCTVAQIAKSLVFKGASGNAVLAVVSGSNRVSELRLSKLAGETVHMADPDFVREKTGYAIGGVPPIGHTHAMETWIDADLLEFDDIWAAAGTPNAVFRLAPPHLITITGGTVVDREQLIEE